MRFYVKRKRTPQIIIVSLIDIFAMLLIFFIVTTTFKTAQSELSIKLPESKTAPPPSVCICHFSPGSLTDLFDQ